jgi:hypothetical protein
MRAFVDSRMGTTDREVRTALEQAQAQLARSRREVQRLRGEARQRESAKRVALAAARAEIGRLRQLAFDLQATSAPDPKVARLPRVVITTFPANERPRTGGAATASLPPGVIIGPSEDERGRAAPLPTPTSASALPPGVIIGPSEGERGRATPTRDTQRGAEVIIRRVEDERIRAPTSGGTGVRFGAGLLGVVVLILSLFGSEPNVCGVGFAALLVVGAALAD